MANKKYYAVKVGHKTGVFTSWSEFMYAVKGYSGPSFCAFLTKEEAYAYYNDPNAMVISLNDPAYKRRAAGKV